MTVHTDILLFYLLLYIRTYHPSTDKDSMDLSTNGQLCHAWCNLRSGSRLGRRSAAVHDTDTKGADVVIFPHIIDSRAEKRANKPYQQSLGGP
jgi:hypothetical protein